jgi:hypothetical protein
LAPFTDAATVPAMRILTRILIGALSLFNAVDAFHLLVP